MNDKQWFDAHPEYTSYVRPYITGEFDGIPLFEGMDFHYVHVLKVDEIYAAYIPLLMDITEISVIVKDRDKPLFQKLLSLARRISLHAELYESEQGMLLKAYCTDEQFPHFESLIQNIFREVKKFCEEL